MVLVALGALAVVAVVVAISTGSVTIPVHALWSYLSSGDAGQPGWTVLLDQIRLPRVATAALAGAGLAVAGLLMQTMFANPLADPYILGVSSGASLGVAVVTLGTGTATTTFVSAVGAGRLSVVAAAAVGSLAVLLLILLLGRWVRSVVTLLILGVMLSSTIGAVVSLFLAFADPARLQRFVLWGLGSYGGVTRTDLLVLSPVVVIGVVTALLLSRSLNALLLGERYAQTMGVNVSLVRVVAVTATALIAGSVTAYCGPIAFLGIAVPHLARLGIGTSDHRVLLPATVLMGITVSVLCSVVAQLPGTDAVLPLNVVTALLGAPVVMVVLLRSRRLAAGAV
ncbi:iron ABC transporter permease [Microlunatus panaciterrae]